MSTEMSELQYTIAVATRCSSEDQPRWH
uniref:Uncharacterized protein n=1 Tax=Arundo donax TaxID=35708 RepID=A0A0A9G406_ARUDO